MDRSPFETWSHLVEADLYVFSAEEGGPGTPFLEGSNSMLSSAHYQAADCRILRRVQPEGGREFEPGKRYIAEIWLARVPNSGFTVGEKFGLWERMDDLRLVAEGEVRRIFKPT